MNDKFIGLYDKYKDDIFRLAYSYFKNIYDADDILQNVFIKLYKHKDILELKELDIKKWLCRVTINECKNNLISFWKKQVHSITEKEENNLYTMINDNYVLNSVMELKKKERIIVYLYYYEGYKIKEISNILNLSETNIQTILSRARLELKNKLGDDFDE